MTDAWSPEELQHFSHSRELEIAVRSDDGNEQRPTPIWVVVVDGHVYVRSWYRRDTGWFGHAVRSGRARVHVSGVNADVHVDDVGTATVELRESVDAAYRGKYGAGSSSMVTDDAAATTLRLERA